MCLKFLVRPRGVAVHKQFNKLACPTAPTALIETISVSLAMSNHLLAEGGGGFLTATGGQSNNGKAGCVPPLRAIGRDSKHAQACQDQDRFHDLPPASGMFLSSWRRGSVCRGVGMSGPRYCIIPAVVEFGYLRKRASGER